MFEIKLTATIYAEKSVEPTKSAFEDGWNASAVIEEESVFKDNVHHQLFLVS